MEEKHENEKRNCKCSGQILLLYGCIYDCRLWKQRATTKSDNKSQAGRHYVWVPPLDDATERELRDTKDWERK